MMSQADLGLIGTDIEKVDRFKNISDKFRNRVFTSAEISYCESKAAPAEHYCGKYAAKEAVYKALADKVGEGEMTETEIISEGRPEAKPSVEVSESNLSISHTEDYAVAFYQCLI